MKRLFLVCLALLVPLLLANSCRISATAALESDPDPLQARLKSYIDSIRVIDTHEHQRLTPELRQEPVDAYQLIRRSYLNGDLNSAGLTNPGDKPEGADAQDWLWESYGPYLDATRNTTYYTHQVDGFRLLYGFEGPYFTRENMPILSEAVARNYQDCDSWHAEAARKIGFELMFNDHYWDQYLTAPAFEFQALVFRADNFINSVSKRQELEAAEADTINNPFFQARREGFAIRTLDDYVAYLDRWFQRFVEARAVCAKNANAYQRTLYYEDVPPAVAERLFARPSGSLCPAEAKQLQDYIFHQIIQGCGRYGLPIQIHTGYLAGNSGQLDNGQPMKLLPVFKQYPEVRFDLFHGGYPWYQEIAAIAKSYPNVYANLVWLPQISREAAVRALHEWLDCVPATKLFWGGDCSVIEGSAGSLEVARDVVAQVLAERVRAGLMTEEYAREVALGIFRANAIRVFELERRLGRSFS